MPVLRTKRMPVRTWRKSRGLRPGKRKRRGGGGGSSGWRRCHSSSDTRAFMACPSLESGNVPRLQREQPVCHGFHSFLTLLAQPRQLLQQVPVLEPVLLRELQRGRRVAV